MDNGLLLVISGPSGVGKGTIVNEIKNRYENLSCSISVTTRPPRIDEVEGKHYFFLSKEDFLRRIVKHDFLEYALVYGNYYGTPRDEVFKKLDAGEDVVLEIDINGAMQVKSNYPEAVLIYILPPSFSVLKERLINRETDSPEVIARRLQAVHEELQYISEYDYLVINDQLSKAVDNVSSIINAARCRSKRVLENNNYFADIVQEG